MSNNLLTSLLDINPLPVGEDMFGLMVELYPICRSITGDGVRKTLKVIQRHIILQIHEIPSGTMAFDWEIPLEWNIDDAYIIDPYGRKIIDFHKSNLHVVNYSSPIKGKLSLEELRPHLHSLPEQPDAIPYLTTYYAENWGFCLPHRQLLELENGEYDVCIESSLKPGSLTYGELLIPGQTEDEVLISCYTCHPSLCNDNLSGIVLCTCMAKTLAELQLRYSYRFLFIPETIGAIAWLSRNEEHVHRIKHGLVVTCVGGGGPLTYKKTRRGDAEIDAVVSHVLKHLSVDYRVLDFFPYGSDERQFCSPGFNLPVGSLMRTPYYQFPEYHTSLDNLDYIRPSDLADSFSKYLAIVYILELNGMYVNTQPKCEPQLGRRGLYRLLGAQKNPEPEIALAWVLNLSDGYHTLLDICERSGLDFRAIREAADALLIHKLLRSI